MSELERCIRLKTVAGLRLNGSDQHERWTMHPSLLQGLCC